MYLQRMTLAGTHQAQQIAEECLAMCPEIPTSYRILALVYLNYYWYDSSKPPGENIEKAIEFSQKTLALDDNNVDWPTGP